MKISKDMWNHAWKLTLTVAIAVGGYFGFAPGSDESQKSAQPSNSSPNSATGIEGDININNYPPQSPTPQNVAQSTQENSSPAKSTAQNITGNGNITGDGNVTGDGNTITNGNGNSTKTDNSSQTTNIEEQVNTDKNIQTEQYNENNGSGIANCNDTSGSCVENLTIEGN